MSSEEEKMACPACHHQQTSRAFYASPDKMNGVPCESCGKPITVVVPFFRLSAPKYGWYFVLTEEYLKAKKESK